MQRLFVDTSSRSWRESSLVERGTGVVVQCASWDCETVATWSGDATEAVIVLRAGTTGLPDVLVDRLTRTDVWSPAPWHVDSVRVWCPEHAGLVNPELWGFVPRVVCVTCFEAIWIQPRLTSEQEWARLALLQGWEQVAS